MYFDFLPFLRSKKNKDERDKSITYYGVLTDAINLVSSIFVYDNPPDGLNTKWMEYYLITEGYCGIGRIGNDIIAMPGSISGPIDAYNIGTHFEGTCPIGSISGDKGIDIVLMRNNEMLIPDIDLATYTDLITELYTSIRCGILNSRSADLLLTDSDIASEELKSAVRSSWMGVPKLITSKRLNINAYMRGQNNIVDKVTLNDIKDSDKLKYLTSLYEDIQRIMLRKYGVHLTNNSKLAQANIDETNDGKGMSLLLVSDMLNVRRRGVDQINTLFNANMSVSLNPVIVQTAIEYYDKGDNEDDIDITPKI